MSSNRVAIAMSGGVDSSVAAGLLKEEGYQVIGMMMSLWSEDGREEHNRCCTPDAMGMAKRVAALLEIPFYAVDAKKPFYNHVVSAFYDGYANNVTPNPCLVCNHYIRWGFLREYALAQGAHFIATGHYARLQSDDQNRFQLLRAIDDKKDQSYVLYSLSQEQLSQTLLPLGGYTKSQIREIAAIWNLPIAEKPDSQDLCFLGNGDYRAFILRNAPNLVNPGPVIRRDGNIIGRHEGLPFYTIGQRKGIRISGPEPMYVLAKDPIRNSLVVGTLDELGKKHLSASQVNWISAQIPEEPFYAQVKIRYRSKFYSVLITPLNDEEITVDFNENILDITPGQAVVIYKDDICLGGGIINQT